MAQDAFKMGSWAVLGSKLGLKMGQNRSQERSETLSIRWSIWRLIFEAIWSELGSIFGSKNLSKWSQVGCKIDPSLVLIWQLFLKGFRYHFLFNFVNYNTKSMFLICCWCALGMILGLIFDRFLVDFGIENRWKIDEKSIKKQIKNKMRFGIDFWRFLDGFWGGFGGQVGAKLGPKSIKNRSWNKHATKMMFGNY